MQLQMTQLPMSHLQMISASVDTGGTDWLWLAKPAFASMGILQAMGVWNAILWPLLVLKGAEIFQKYIIEGMTAGAVKG